MIGNSLNTKHVDKIISDSAPNDPVDIAGVFKKVCTAKHIHSLGLPRLAPHFQVLHLENYPIYLLPFLSAAVGALELRELVLCSSKKP